QREERRETYRHFPCDGRLNSFRVGRRAVVEYRRSVELLELDDVVVIVVPVRRDAERDVIREAVLPRKIVALRGGRLVLAVDGGRARRRTPRIEIDVGKVGEVF